MKKFVLPALAVALFAGSAFGQATLNFRIRPYTSSGNTATTPGTLTYTASSDQVLASTDVRRFVLEYNVTDASGATFPAGLVASAINLTLSSTGGAGVSTLAPALLTRFQANTNNGLTPPNATSDASGSPTGASVGVRGVHRPYRGGFAVVGNNADPSNGTAGTANGLPALLTILPLAISQTDQNVPGAFYGLFSFELTNFSGAGNIVISASTDSAGFGYFDDGVAVPVTQAGTFSTTFTQSVNIPAPASAALLGLGGLVAARRRRA